MNDLDAMQLTIIVSTMVVLLFLSLLVLLLILNNTRRIRHRAEVAELQQQKERAVMEAEREATKHTLREMGRELHDNVGQLLAVAQLGLNTALECPDPDPHLGPARDALEQGIDEVRRLGHDLNTDLWQQRSLVDAISTEAERLERVGRVRVHLLRRGVPPVLAADHSTILFRAFQEVITNALKHSGADTIEITVAGDPHFSLTITDNGVGFDRDNGTSNAGLLNINKRCALIGFEALCTTAPGRGCSWRLQPLPRHGS